MDSGDGGFGVAIAGVVAVEVVVVDVVVAAARDRRLRGSAEGAASTPGAFELPQALIAAAASSAMMACEKSVRVASDAGG